MLCCTATYAKDSSPLPRFASLRSDEVNVRIGPGKRYAISWVYHREGFPVEIIQEFDHWRKIRDFEGDTGWIYKNMLSSGKRAALVIDKPHPLRRSPDNDSPALLIAEPGVIGQLIECVSTWCRLQINSRKGWMPKAHLWGVYDDEEF